MQLDIGDVALPRVAAVIGRDAGSNGRPAPVAMTLLLHLEFDPGRPAARRGSFPVALGAARPDGSCRITDMASHWQRPAGYRSGAAVQCSVFAASSAFRKSGTSASSSLKHLPRGTYRPRCRCRSARRRSRDSCPIRSANAWSAACRPALLGITCFRASAIMLLSSACPLGQEGCPGGGISGISPGNTCCGRALLNTCLKYIAAISPAWSAISMTLSVFCCNGESIRRCAK